MISYKNYIVFLFTFIFCSTAPLFGADEINPDGPTAWMLFIAYQAEEKIADPEIKIFSYIQKRTRNETNHKVYSHLFITKTKSNFITITSEIRLVPKKIALPLKEMKDKYTTCEFKEGCDLYICTTTHLTLQQVEDFFLKIKNNQIIKGKFEHIDDFLIDDFLDEPIK